MSGYTKLFNSILASTIWRSSDTTRIVWITLLAMADKDGIAEGSIPGLADLARVSIEDCETALAELEAPDPYSRTSEHEGRRIEVVDGVGWRLLNHAKYRMKMSEDERREYNRQKQAEYRARQKELEASKDVNECQEASITVNDSEQCVDIQKQIHIQKEEKEDIVSVFEHWKKTMNHPRVKLDKPRRELIERRLKDFTVEELKTAIDGCKKSPWHQGQNPTNTIYDKLTLILRNNENVESFIEKTKDQAATPTLSEEEQAARDAVTRGREMYYASFQRDS